MFEVPLNNSPELSMEEITKLLFNNEFMSDIQFRIGERVIYGHSWEIMKRSVVFHQQFRTNLGENKLIPIEDVKYEAFYQFLRFIYTDEIDIGEHLISDVLILAVRYKVVKLETKVMNMSYKSNDPDLEMFEISILNKSVLCGNYVLNNILRDLNGDDLKGEAFLKIHTNAFEEILKSNIGFNHLSEVDLFNGLVQWMNYSCEKNRIPLVQRRSRFGKLIRLIRFPAMVTADFHLCVQKHPDLLTNDDIGTIMRASLVSSNDENRIWNDNPRLKYQEPWSPKRVTSKTKWITKFTVLGDLILRGIRFGTLASSIKPCEIKLSSKNLTTNIIDVFKLKYTFIGIPTNIISLGDSFKLTPNHEYSIEILLLSPQFHIIGRSPNVNAMVTGSTELATLIEASENLIELFFKSPSE